MSDQEVRTTPSASAQLTAAREQLGFSQKEVADKLYLTTTFIRHIDAGEFDKIPKQAFVKGYLRSYARVVNLSGDEIVAVYEAELEAHAPEPEIKDVTEENVGSSAITGPVLQSGLIGLGGLVLVVALVWWLVAEPDEPPVTVTQPTVSTPERPEPESEPEDFEFVAEAPDPELASAAQEALEDGLQESLEIAAAESSQPEMPAESVEEDISTDGTDASELLAESDVSAFMEEQTEDPTEVSASEDEPLDEVRFERTTDGARSFVTVDAGGFDQVELSFSGECWVEIADDTRGLIYNDLNREGDVLTIYGTAPFEILLGKATGVEMIYNGRPFEVGPYISQDETAKLTVSE